MSKYHNGYNFYVYDNSVNPRKNEYFWWANDHFGPNGEGNRWDANARGYYFRDEEDYVWFMLKWGNHDNFKDGDLYGWGESD